ncbi:MAG: beta-ketoacyl synthase N-terminal-like domain-containing protein [Planctomycetota bacterium]
MSSPRRVVITGLGVLSPIGLDAGKFWDSLVAGKSGIRRITAFDAQSLPAPIAGEIDGFDPKSYIEKKERKSLRVMARTIQLAVAAAQVALDDSKIQKDKLDPARFGVEFGSGLIPSELQELGAAAKTSANCQPGVVDLKVWGTQGIPQINPLWMLKYLPNMLACHVSILHNAQGPSNSITESDVAGLLALGEATRILRRNIADLFLVGGADSKINPLSMSRQAVFQHLSKRGDDPARASRPFDAQRDGLIIGEGGSVVVAEDLEHAKKRGATIYGEVLGFGSAFDRGLTGKGLARALRAALTPAKLTPADIDHVNAHGLSHPTSDAWEAQGIAEVFGPNSITVWAVKSYVGNLGAGADMAELAASLLALKYKKLPGTLNYDFPDPRCPVNVTRETTATTKPNVLKVGFTEMGQCAAVVCRAWE